WVCPLLWWSVSGVLYSMQPPHHIWSLTTDTAVPISHSIPAYTPHPANDNKTLIIIPNLFGPLPRSLRWWPRRERGWQWQRQCWIPQRLHWSAVCWVWGPIVWRREYCYIRV